MSHRAEALTLALRCHQSGDLPRAESLYRQILDSDPNHADAWHLLGVIAQQQGQGGRAADLIGRAVSLRPDVAVYHNSLGAALKDQGRWAEALAHYEEALRLRPDYAETRNNLGNLLKIQGRLEEAIVQYQETIWLKPHFAEAHHNLGSALREQGRRAEATECHRHALRLKPDFIDAHLELGGLLLEDKNWQQAADSFEQALRRQPGNFLARYNLGYVLQEQGKLAEAIVQYREALRLRPDLAQAHNNLGSALQELGQTAEAGAHFQEALRLRPNFAEAFNNLGSACQEQNQFADAIVHYSAALRLAPGFAQAHNNLGRALVETGARPAGLAHYHEALRLLPELAQAHNNLGDFHLEEGRLQEALDSYRKAFQLKPDFAAAHSSLLFSLTHDPNADLDKVFAEHRRWGERYEKESASSASFPRSHTLPAHLSPRDEPETAAHATQANDASSDRRLKIGYVSADFRKHAVAHFLEPILAHHDPAAFEVFCYSNTRYPDAVTARLQALAHSWRSIGNLTDERVVDIVRADRIDILVDLSGHTTGKRPRVFAQKPAPVQATYLGYPNTTGLKTIDYRLTDAVLDPPGAPIRDTEELIRLPRSFCYAAPADAPAVSPLPAQRTGHITFGSLHRLAKLNARVLDAWCLILEAVPTSRLLVLRDALAGNVQEEYQRRFVERGIPAERVELRQLPENQDYLTEFAAIDIALDTFPWTGHVISCEALWMGVPIPTLAGLRPAGRLTASILTTLGLAEWIAGTPEQYVETVVRLANDWNQLESLRGRLRGLMETTLCDGQRFTRDLETAYRRLWHRMVSGEG